MAKLVVSIAGVVDGHYFLDKDRFTIGRKPDNDIFLDDPVVSNVHAVIVTVSNDQVLEDAASTNGIRVNGEKVTRRILQNNDVIEVGGYQLKYINQRATPDMDFDKTLIVKAAQLNPHVLPEAEELQGRPHLTTAAPTARSVKTSFPLGGVKGMEGQYAGQDILISRPLKTFGQPGVQLVMIARRPHGYYLTHVEGKRQPRVNGKSIGTQAYLLKENDLIEAGNVKLQFFIQRP